MAFFGSFNIPDLSSILGNLQLPAEESKPELFPSRRSALGESTSDVSGLGDSIGTLPTTQGRLGSNLSLGDLLGGPTTVDSEGGLFNAGESVGSFGGLPSDTDSVVVGGQTLSGFKRIDVDGVSLFLDAQGQIFQGQAVPGDSPTALASKLRKRIFGRQATILTGTTPPPNIRRRVLT